MQKNVGGQKWVVFAFNTTNNAAVTGDASNITANLRLDGGAANAIDDTNPTELEDGYYIFDITQAESNADLISIHPASTTSDVQVVGTPAAVWTRPPNFTALGIEADGDLGKVNALDGHTAQTGDSYARIGAPAGASLSADVAAIKADTDTIKSNQVTMILGISDNQTDLNTLLESSKYLGAEGLGIFYDQNSGISSTNFGEDGTVDRPVNSWAAVQTLLGLSSYHVVYLMNGSTATVTTDESGIEFVGVGDMTLNQVDLNSRDLDGCKFRNLSVTGAQGGTDDISLCDCLLSSLTSLRAKVRNCAVGGNIALRANVNNVFDDCWGSVFGASPQITFAAGSDAIWTHYSGRLQLMSLAAGMTAAVEGEGEVIIDVSCTGGALALSGNIEQTDNAGGAVTVTDPARVTPQSIREDIDANSTQLAAILADTNELQTDDVPGLLAALNDPTASAIAEAVLKLDWTGVSGEPARCLLQAMRYDRNRKAVAAGVLTVYKENGTDVAWTAILTSDSNADPIVEIAPT